MCLKIERSKADQHQTRWFRRCLDKSKESDTAKNN